MGFGKRDIKFPGGRILKLIYTISIVLAVAFAFFFITADLERNPGDVSPEASEPCGGRSMREPVTASMPEPDKAKGDKAAADKKAGDGSPVSVNSTTLSPDVYSPVTLADGQKATVRWDSDTGVPAFLTGDIAAPAANGVEGAALAFLDANGDLYRMAEPEKDLKAERTEQDDLGMSHLYFGQSYNGVPVFGSDLAIHFSASGRIVAVNGRYVPDINISTEPFIDADDAGGKALEALGVEAGQPEAEPAELVILTPGGGEPVLTWKVTLEAAEPPLRMIYFIDAQSGEVAGSYDDLEDVKNRNTYTAGNGTSLPGTLLISEGGSSGDAVAQAAHNNTGTTYDYYYNTFGRDSFNGSGATLKSTVHYSNRYNNAFWNGAQMVYGDGDGSVFSPLGSSLDVVAHELTHAVTQYTAGLIYSYQSGALNESYSDVFGVMVDRDDWLLGEDVYTPATPGDALRSLSNPPQFGQPDHMNNYVNTSSDNGGVHTNSGIPNKAAYNIATAIGKDKMEKIWYRTLTMYLTSGSQFNDARDASLQAAADLYGSYSAEATAVQSGFSAVGLGGTTSTTTARIEIDHTYRGDLVVTLGVGNPASPTWTTTVSNRQGGSADNLYTTVDIAAGAAYLPPDWQNRWFVKVYDAASYDVGQIKKFTITDNGNTYTATDVPVAINDFQTSYSYVPTSDNTPPTVASTRPAGALTYENSRVSATFSEQINASTLNSSSFTLTRNSDGAPVAGQLSYDSGTMTATLQLNEELQYSVAYTATITTAVTDLAGNPLVSQYQWSFTTREYVPPYFSWYDYGSNTTGLYQFKITDDGYAPNGVWFSGSGNWDWSRSKTTVSDRDNDGKTELDVFYDYGNSTAGLYVFDPANGYEPQVTWSSCSGCWDFSRFKVVTAADQLGADVTSLTVLYDYGNDNAGLFVVDPTTGATDRKWISGPGNWDWNRSRILTAANFDSDPSIEMAILYDYGNANTGIFIFDPESWGTPQRVWLSGPGNLEFQRSKITVADLSGDGKAEVALLYNYGNANSALFLFDPASGYTPDLVWYSGPGNWEWSRSNILTGVDQNNDSRTELAILYNYGNANSALFLVNPVSSPAYSPYQVWLSGAGNWDWNRTKPV